MPKVSVVVPVYNVEHYLETCVRSILSQTEGDFELLLVDDGATDGSGALCDELARKDGRVRVIHQENRGLGGARDSGIREAQGDWLLLVDSDDWIDPDILERAVKAAEDTGASMAVFGFRTVDEQGKRLQDFLDPLPTGRALSPQERKDCLLISPCAWNKLYRRELFAETGLTYPSRVWYEDIRTTPKLLAHMGETGQTVVFLDAVGYNYLQRAGSIMNNGNIRRNEEILWAFDDLLPWFRERELFDEYREELCYLAVYHVYLTASVRVMRQEKRSPLIDRFSAYLREQFPDYRRNRYLPERLSRNQRLLLSLLEKDRRELIRLLFRIRGRG